jgi:hypothetical protein
MQQHDNQHLGAGEQFSIAGITSGFGASCADCHQNRDKATQAAGRGRPGESGTAA